jgi:hypothetical protein
VSIAKGVSQNALRFYETESPSAGDLPPQDYIAA